MTDTFETERLICRRFEADDLEDMFRNWASDPMIQPEYGEPVYDDIDMAAELLERYIRGYSDPNFYRWAVIEKKSMQNIGQIAFCRVYPEIRTAEVEYCIGQGFWGNGYAKEALSGLIEHTFNALDIDMIEAYHRTENIRSGRVLEKSMMHRTDTAERFRREGKAPEGEVCYCIRREEYR